MIRVRSVRLSRRRPAGYSVFYESVREYRESKRSFGAIMRAYRRDNRFEPLLSIEQDLEMLRRRRRRRRDEY